MRDLHGLAAPYTAKWLRLQDALDLALIEDVAGEVLVYVDLAISRAQDNDLVGLHRALQHAVFQFRYVTTTYKVIKARHAIAREKTIERAA